MGYLYPADYNKAIQDVSLQQIISGDVTLLPSAELFAQGLMKSHLVQKYDVDQEFTNTQVYNPQSTYSAGDRVYLDATTYNAASTYTEGQLTLQAGKVYQCTVAIVAPEAFNVAHWTLLGNQYDLFYVNYPHPVFNIHFQYKKDDRVWYKNHVYKALIGTRYYDHVTMIQFGNTNNIPFANYFPDDPNNGTKAWHNEGEYEVPVGSILTLQYFTRGDNRNQQMVQYMLDIMIYRLYTRTIPKNVPEERKDNYQLALMWLRDCAKGNDITADLTKLQPSQGGRIRWGSNIKQQNSY